MSRTLLAFSGAEHGEHSNGDGGAERDANSALPYRWTRQGGVSEVSIQSAAARTGGWGYQAIAKNLAIGTEGWDFTATTNNRYIFGFGVKLVAQAAAGEGANTAFRLTIGSITLGTSLSEAGVITFTGGGLGSPTWTPTLNQQYFVELVINYVAAGTDTCEVWIDDVLLASGTIAHSGTALASAYIGFETFHSIAVDGKPKLYHDDLYLMNTDEPAAAARYGSTFNVRASRATADSADGSFVNASGAGNTNLFEATNNAPPTGTFNNTPATDGTLILSTAAAPDTCDFTMQSYDTIGVPANYAILGVKAVAELGKPTAASGAQTGGVQIVSNPTIAETSVTVTPLTDNTYWSGVFTPPALNPEVTRATSPVLRLRRITGTTGEATYFDGASIAVASFRPRSLVIPRRRNRAIRAM